MDIIPVSQVDSLSGYNDGLIGGAITMGAWRQDALALVESHQAALQEMLAAQRSLSGLLCRLPDDGIG